MATVPTTGPVTWDYIRFVFGGGYPIYASQYYRGGGLVPNIPANYGVPTSGTLYASQFRGATNYVNVSGSVSGGSVSYNNGLSGTPTTRVMSTTATASASGGTGSYTYTWSITGSSNISGTPSISGSGASVTVQATARINLIGTVTVQCVISDGTSSVTVSGNCTYNYFNGA